jgi:hypothetical protein
MISWSLGALSYALALRRPHTATRSAGAYAGIS